MTLKQKKFVAEYLANKGNGTKAVLNIYDVKKAKNPYNLASSIASENLTKPSIRQEIENALKKANFGAQNIIDKLIEHSQDKRPTISISAIKELKDIIGLEAPKHIENTNKNIDITPEQSEVITNRLREALTNAH